MEILSTCRLSHGVVLGNSGRCDFVRRSRWGANARKRGKWTEGTGDGGSVESSSDCHRCFDDGYLRTF